MTQQPLFQKKAAKVKSKTVQLVSMLFYQYKSGTVITQCINQQIKQKLLTMKQITTLIVISIIFLTLAQAFEAKPIKMSFEEFKEKFNKTYDSPEQQAGRKVIFLKNRKQINQKRNCTTCGITQFSDLTQQEFQGRYLNLKQIDNKPEPPREKVKVQGYEEVHPDPIKVSSVGNNDNTFDWRDFGKVTSVKNQGLCGSCWTFAVAAAVESFALVENKAEIGVDLAEQFLLECTQGSTCNGGYLEYSMDTVLNKGGMPYESKYPYNYTNYYGSQNICSAEIDLVNPAKRRFTKYGIQDDQIIEYLHRSPISVDLSATNWGSYDSQQNKILSCGPNDNINHAVLLVGYTDEYWIVKNSWGTWWGDEGYAYINRDRTNNQNCKIGNSVHVWADECGLNNCDLCEVNKVSCEKCASGYYQQYIPNSYDLKCEACLDPNCDLCFHTQYSDNIVGKCSLCKKGWSLDFTETRQCHQIDIPNCEMYWRQYDRDYCYACDVGYVRSSNYGECLKCEVENCHECQRDRLDVCDTCIEGYEGPNCDFKCVENCATGCSTPFICDRCYDGFTGDDCSIVECEVDNCDAGCSTANVCDECNKGWTGSDCQTPVNIECGVSNCVTCSDSDNCQVCEPGYSGHDCLTLVANSQTNCYVTVKNCAEGCSDPQKCDRCDAGYYGPTCIFDENSLSACESHIFGHNLNTVSSTQLSTSQQQQLSEKDDTISNLETGIITISIVLFVCLVVIAIQSAFMIQTKRNTERQTKKKDEPKPELHRVDSMGSATNINTQSVLERPSFVISENHL